VLEDGGYELKVPYTDDRELLMDVLKFGADCEVVAPLSLKQRVATELMNMQTIYADRSREKPTTFV
jgi:predicted DNA-binding transcriptional regulator YafY